MAGDHFVCDIEANGLLLRDGLIKPLDTIWCIVAKNIVTKELFKFEPDAIEDGLAFLSMADTIIGHNFIGYDLIALDMVYGFKTDAQILDTLVWSRALNPDRKLAMGCPTHYDTLAYDKKRICGGPGMDDYHPMKPKKSLIGPHSLAAWGYKVGKLKPSHSDWMNYSPEMLHRCVEDTEINFKVLFAMLKEADISIDQVLNWETIHVPGIEEVA